MSISKREILDIYKREHARHLAAVKAGQLDEATHDLALQATRSEVHLAIRTGSPEARAAEAADDRGLAGVMRKAWDEVEILIKIAGLLDGPPEGT